MSLVSYPHQDKLERPVSAYIACMRPLWSSVTLRPDQQVCHGLQGLQEAGRVNAERQGFKPKNVGCQAVWGPAVHPRQHNYSPEGHKVPPRRKCGTGEFADTPLVLAWPVTRISLLISIISRAFMLASKSACIHHDAISSVRGKRAHCQRVIMG